MKYFIKLLLLLNFFTLGANEITFDEQSVIEASKKDNPTIDQIEQAYLASKLQLLQFDDQFNSSLYGNTSYSKTNEKQFGQFQPVTSPIKSSQLGIKSSFKQGFSLSVGAFNNQTTNSFVHEGTLTGLNAQLSLDLWKNFLGRSANAKFKGLESFSKRASLESKINKTAFTQNIRKLYWSLVANNEAIKITKKLLSSSKLQVQEANRRFKKKIADSGEVSRYKSQVAARSAQIVSLQYQRESLIQSLKELIPEWSNKNLKLGAYDVEAQVDKVLKCTAVIAQSQRPPLDNTLYDDVLTLLKEEKANELKVSKLYNHADVHLVSEVKYFGKDLGNSKAMDEFSDNPAKSYSIGLSFDIPIEGKRKTTKDILNKLNNKKYKALEENTFSKIEAYHGQIIRTVSLLREIVKNQKENTYHLERSLKSSKRKFNQARLSVQQLVQEQDAFLQSNLDEIQTKLNVIHTLLDYLSVYTETSCEMNRI